MKIIDFKIMSANTVRFYLGDDNCEDYYGDDWDDTPYEHNAGTVYDEFIKGYRDMYFDISDVVLEPCDGQVNSRFCKDDMKACKVPCVIVVRGDNFKHGWEREYATFDEWVGCGNAYVEKFYFGDFLIPGVSYSTKELGLFFDENGKKNEG